MVDLTDVVTTGSGQRTSLGQIAHHLLGEKRITGGAFRDRGGQPADRGSGPSSPATSAAISESLSGARAMLCAPGTRLNAPRYSGR